MYNLCNQPQVFRLFALFYRQKNATSIILVLVCLAKFMGVSESADSGFPHHPLPTSPQVPLAVSPWLSERLQPTVCKAAAWPLSLWGSIVPRESHELSSGPTSPAITPASGGAPLNCLVTSLPCLQGIANDLNGWHVLRVQPWNLMPWRVLWPHNMHSTVSTSLGLFISSPSCQDN